jgi:hypothetical protein
MEEDVRAQIHCAAKSELYDKVEGGKGAKCPEECQMRLPMGTWAQANASSLQPEYDQGRGLSTFIP